MALLEVRDVIQYGRPHGRHLGFYKKFKFIGKTRKLQIFFAKVVKYDAINYFAAFGGVLKVFH